MKATFEASLSESGQVRITPVASHTPGPWKTDLERWQVYADNGSLICKIATGEDRAEEEANTRLIASAPELRIALEACLRRLEWHRDNLTSFPLDLAAADRARAALKLERGSK